MSKLDAALQSFNVEKTQLESTADELLVFLERNNRPDLAREAKLLRQTLGNDAIKVAVLGEFKGGKSTLINSMLGNELLPAWTWECTAAITQVAFAPEPALFIHYIDEKIEPEQKDIKELEAIATTNNADFNSISYLEIRYPAELLKNGIMIVDTPGTNSAVEARGLISRKFMSIADVAILVLNAQAILTQSEFDLIRNELVTKHYGSIFVVVNRCDLVDDKAQLATEIEKKSIELKGLIPSLAKVYPLSALNALEGRLDGNVELVSSSGIEDLEEDLALYVVEKGAQHRLQRVKGLLRDILSDCVRDARMRLASLNLDKDKADAQARKEADLLNREVETLKALKDEANAGFAKMKLKLGNEIREKSEESRRTLEDIYCGTHSEKPDASVIEGRMKSEASIWQSHAEQQWSAFYSSVMTYTANYLANVDKELASGLDMSGNYSLSDTSFAPGRIAIRMETRKQTEYIERYEARSNAPELGGLGIGMMVGGLILGGWIGLGLALFGGGLFGSSRSSGGDLMEKIRKPVEKNINEFRLDSLAEPYSIMVSSIINKLDEVLDKSLEDLLKQVEEISAMHYEGIKERKKEIEYQRTETELPKEVARLKAVEESAEEFIQRLS